MANLIVLKFEDNYSDEFDVSGMAIVERDWWENHKKEATERWGVGEREYGFGTNEDLIFEDADDYLSKFMVYDPTDAQVEFLQSLFGGDRFGCVPQLSFDDAEEDEEDDDDT